MPRASFAICLSVFLGLPNAAWGQKDTQNSACELILVVPQDRHDRDGAAFAFRSWLAKTRPLFRPCDRFLTGSSASDILAPLNIHDANDFVSENIAERQIALLRSQRSFSKILVMKYTVADQKLQIQPELYSLTDEQAENDQRNDLEQTIPLTANSPSFTKTFWQKVWNTVVLKPNALLVGGSTATLINEREQNGEVVELDHQQSSFFPPLVNGISVTSIEHPNGFANWDISSRIFTSFNLLYFDDTYTYLTNLQMDSKKNNTIVGEETKYRLQMYGMAIGLNEELTLHTPVGGFFASAGLGVAPYIYHDTLGEGFNGISIIARGAGGYRAFLTNRFYFQSAVELMHPMPQFVANSIFVSNVTAYGFVGFGMFLPGAFSRF